MALSIDVVLRLDRKEGPRLNDYDEHKYRKTATVFARKVSSIESIKIYSLEGLAIARPGDYVCRADTEEGEEWVVAGNIFEATYERIEDE